MGERILLGILVVGCILAGIAVFMTVESAPPEAWPNPPAGASQ